MCVLAASGLLGHNQLDEVSDNGTVLVSQWQTTVGFE